MLSPRNTTATLESRASARDHHSTSRAIRRGIGLRSHSAAPMSPTTKMTLSTSAGSGSSIMAPGSSGSGFFAHESERRHAAVRTMRLFLFIKSVLFVEREADLQSDLPMPNAVTFDVASRRANLEPTHVVDGLAGARHRIANGCFLTF